VLSTDGGAGMGGSLIDGCGTSNVIVLAGNDAVEQLLKHRGAFAWN